jgi:hypothetical protein
MQLLTHLSVRATHALETSPAVWWVLTTARAQINCLGHHARQRVLMALKKKQHQAHSKQCAASTAPLM